MKKFFTVLFFIVSYAGFAQTLTPVLYPQYIEGVGSGNPSDNRSVPYACRMTLNGLIPNRLYYYYNRFVTAADLGSTVDIIANGQGTIIVPNATTFQRITGPNLSDAGTAGTFTTDANGNYTGWFITEPTASNTFFPGNQIYWRIMLRNEQFTGPGGNLNAVEMRLTASTPVTVLQWLSYVPAGSPTPPTGFVGTLLTRAANAEYTAKNFVMLFDNTAGTGRPLSGTFVEDDGISTTTPVDLFYINPYDALSTANTRWGAIIPSGAPQGPGLANGVRNISQYSLATGSVVNVCIGSGTGLFDGTDANTLPDDINTVNHAGTQQTGAGVLNIANCGVALTSCTDLNLSAVVTATNCNANSGAVDLTVTGGTAPYTFSWSNGASSEDITGVAGGNYTVTVTDASGVCTNVLSATVPANQIIALSANITNVLCNGQSNGTIDLTATGGGPFTFSWSNGAVTEDIGGLVADTFIVVVTGAGICTATDTFIVTQPMVLTASASAAPIPNCGGSTTTVTVNGSGGTAPYTGTGNFVVSAGTHNYTITDANGCTANAEVTVTPGSCLTITPVIYPRYIQGEGNGPSNDKKVPYACRMTVNGLSPNATYRYYPTFVADTTSASNGAGLFTVVDAAAGVFNRVPSASISNPGSFGELTTDASGSYTGWFVLEAGSDIDYTPGNQLYFRLILNNGAGGSLVTSRINAPQSVTVINWGTTSGAPLEGSAIYNQTAAAWVPENFVMLYDNTAGTGRPVSGTFIEGEANANTTAEGYDLFYELLVDGQDGVWGTIIPNDLTNGINNISQYALTNGNRISICTSANGVFGTTDTRLASKGNADPFTPDLLLISCTPQSTLPVTLVSFTASVMQDNKVSLVWKTTSEINFSHFIVERSKNGSQYSPIGTVAARGGNSTYSLLDDLTNGITYYRLKMVDIDTRFKYSQVVTVNGNFSSNILAVFPNPAQSTLTVSHEKARPGSSFTITGMSGAKLSVQNIQQGAVQTTIDVSRLPAGTYILIYHNDGENKHVKFSKQ